MRKLLHILTVILTVCMVASCDNTPGYVVSPKKMAEVMADIHTGEAVAETTGGEFITDSARQVLKQTILMRHNVTLEQFDTSLYWYGYHVDKFMEVNDLTIKILESRIKEAEKTGDVAVTDFHRTQEGDSVNIWTWPVAVDVNKRMPSQILPFYFSSDRNWEAGDVYTLRLKSIANQHPVEVLLSAWYSDGTSEVIGADFGEPGFNELKLYLDPKKSAVSLFGSLRFIPGDGDSYVDSISMVRTRNTDRRLYEAADMQHLMQKR